MPYKLKAALIACIMSFAETDGEMFSRIGMSRDLVLA